MKLTPLIVSLLWLPNALWAQTPSTLPRWTSTDDPRLGLVELPAQLQPLPQFESSLDTVVLQLDPTWSPEWRQAAFQIKALIVHLKTKGPDVAIALQASESQVTALMEHELAAYIDGYVFRDQPLIPDADPTGKLWQRVDKPATTALNALLDAASIGIELVIFDQAQIDPEQQRFLQAIRDTNSGSLDNQPEIPAASSSNYHLFMDPSTGMRHLALYLDKMGMTSFILRDDQAYTTTAIFPKDLAVSGKPLGSRQTEIKIDGSAPYVFLQLKPIGEVGATESIQIVQQSTIDPYELVVKNQVFKDAQAKLFRSLEVEEEVNYRYQSPTGATIDITYMDTVIQRKQMPTERIRREMFIGGVKWPYEELLKLPLIQPEKVQREPLLIDLDKSYAYTYLGEEEVNGHKTWKVGFKPKESGDFYTGTVWIDKQIGAHRMIRATQSGLEPPVIGNEVVARFDWVEDGDNRYWTQVSERNLQVLNIIGETIALQIESKRSQYKFNREGTEAVLAAAYASDQTILRDTDEGFKYLLKKDGQRVVSDTDYARQRFLLGGLQIDPSLDYPIPLAGFNYLNLDFMNRGYQLNALVGGALNVVNFANNDIFESGLDFTAELFTTALYFEDTVYEGRETRDDLTVKSLREAVNVTLGIPIGNFFKMSTNYSLRYLDYKDSDKTDPNFVVPNSTFEHIGRVNLTFNRARLSTSLQYETAKRTDWEAWGLAQDMEPIEDSYQSIQFDLSLSQRLPKFQTIGADLRYLKGWNLDRFSRFGFGFFENAVAGFGTSGAEGDEALRARVEYGIGVKELVQLEFSLDGARAWLDDPLAEPTDLAGIGISGNFIGPWKLLLRVNLGYGLYSTLEGEDGDISGQIFLLRVF